MPAVFAAGPSINGHESFIASIVDDGISPLGGLDPNYLLWVRRRQMGAPLRAE